MDKEREIMTSEELALAYAEMHLAGQLEYFDDEKKCRFTEAGLDAAWVLWYGLPPKDRLSLLLLVKLIIETQALGSGAV